MSSDYAGAVPGGKSSSCPSSVEIQLPIPYMAHRFDSVRLITELYSQDVQNNVVVRYDVDTTLSYTVTPLPGTDGLPWIAADLDDDGEIELVTQISDDLNIYSAPDWTLRARSVWPGMNIVSHATAVNIDSDPYIEIFALPNSVFNSRAIIIKYDEILDTFKVISDIEGVEWARGQSAVADFDDDGRVEFIAGNQLGYALFEWQNAGLAYMGQVGGAHLANDFFAATVKPYPDGNLYALLSHNSTSGLYRYELISASGDNQFEIIDTISQQTGFTGYAPCWGADTDCDGIDEMAMTFSPWYKVIQWHPDTQDFVESCQWHENDIGGLYQWYDLDLDQDGSSEWGTINHNFVFYDFPDPESVFCDSVGRCLYADSTCYCFCFGDPQCDSVTNVFDVVKSVDVAFRSAPPVGDPYPLCPRDRTDVSCDGVTNVFDVVAFVDVAFRSADPAIAFCNPCTP